MKQIALLLIAIAFPAGARSQGLPEKPQPAAPQQAQTPIAAESTWDRMGHLPRDQKIKIRFGNGRWEHCDFAGASDQYLYCTGGVDSGYAREWQINRANITDFKIDHDERNGRLIFTAFSVGGGLILGIRTSLVSPASTAGAEGVIGGLIGAGLGALVGSPMSCISGHCVALPNLNPGPSPYPFSVNVPLRRFPLHAHR